MQAKYVHTNLIARDWRSLAGFYQRLFGCVPVPPERDFQGEKLEAGTGIPGAHLQGVHLRLPGYGDSGPTLEIFNYNILKDRPETAVNRPGFGHIAFQVADVPAARAEVLANGGQRRRRNRDAAGRQRGESDLVLRHRSGRECDRIAGMVVNRLYK